MDLTKPRGRVLGIDLLPVQPPKGVSTIQGDFLSPDVQAEIKSFLRDPERGRPRLPLPSGDPTTAVADGHIDQSLLLDSETGYIERERRDTADEEGEASNAAEVHTDHLDKSVDVVLSDMSEPWDPLDGLYKRSISNPYYRLMNTSGNAFRDHAGSMVRNNIVHLPSTDIGCPVSPRCPRQLMVTQYVPQRVLYLLLNRTTLG